MPASPLASASASTLVLPAPRAFGRAHEDLDVDLGSRDRLAATTRIIALCCEQGNSADESGRCTLPSVAEREHLAWSLPLGARIARLLKIVELTIEPDALGIVLTCPQPACRSRFEISLPFAALETDAAEANDAKIVPFPTPTGDSIALRLPTGRDQATWRAQSYATPDDAVRTIIHTLAVRPTCRAGSPDPAVTETGQEKISASPALGVNAHASPHQPASSLAVHEHASRPPHATSSAPDTATAGSGDPALHHAGADLQQAGTNFSGAGVDLHLAGVDLAALSAAMEAADPLVAFSVRTTCPQCEQPADIAVDLEAVALGRLAQQRRSLVRTIHALATRYGWSEDDVIAIPPPRRSEYLRLIDEESSLP